LISIGKKKFNIGIQSLKERKNMIVLCYSSFLKEFSHYLQQLYMESLGKEYNEKGFPKPEGQTVFGGVGTGEQHAFS
jgi:glucose-6-phosphate isomerase